MFVTLREPTGQARAGGAAVYAAIAYAGVCSAYLVLPGVLRGRLATSVRHFNFGGLVETLSPPVSSTHTIPGRAIPVNASGRKGSPVGDASLAYIIRCDDRRGKACPPPALSSRCALAPLATAPRARPSVLHGGAAFG